MTTFHPYPDDRAHQIESAKKLIDLNPLFLDTETTGLGSQDEICEIAVIDIAGNVLLDSLVKPMISIPPSATHIHMITNEMVQDAPSFKDNYINLDIVLRDRIVVVYNTSFDEDMIWHSMVSNQIMRDDVWWKLIKQDDGSWFTPWRDLMEAYAAFYGDWNHYHQSYRWQRLGAAGIQCEISLPANLHRAHADAETTRRILLHMAGADQPKPEPEEKRGEA
jgi:DNA polymerase III epsilon subunit-like protein